MAIRLRDPVHEMVSLRDVMNSLLQEGYARPGAMLNEGAPAMLPLDISENDDEFFVKASLPGIRAEDVQITVHGDTDDPRRDEGGTGEDGLPDAACIPRADGRTPAAAGDSPGFGEREPSS